MIVSGPSGAGKTTVMREVYRQSPVPLVRSVSATTRPPRTGEADGVDYHFLTPEKFQSLRQQGEFLESFEVFGRGCWYGTLNSEVAPRFVDGKWVVLEIDVQGAAAVRRQFADAISIFLRPSSIAELERRLRGRGSENEASIQRRLARAQEELRWADQYQHQVVNDDIDQAVREICRILSQAWEAEQNARRA